MRNDEPIQTSPDSTSGTVPSTSSTISSDNSNMVQELVKDKTKPIRPKKKKRANRVQVQLVAFKRKHNSKVEYGIDFNEGDGELVDFSGKRVEEVWNLTKMPYYFCVVVTAPILPPRVG